MNLKGPPGIGKTAICDVASQMLNRKFIRICFSESMQLEDLMGSYIPVMKEDKIEFSFRIGKMLEALNDKNI